MVDGSSLLEQTTAVEFKGIYAALATRNNTDQVVGNFAPWDFVYTPPVGFSAGGFTYQPVASADFTDILGAVNTTYQSDTIQITGLDGRATVDHFLKVIPCP